MTRREFRDFLDDILGAIALIESMTKGMSFEAKESKTYENKIDHIACLRTANVQREVNWLKY